jgi:NarL family two-component system response regulator LiaR
MRILLAIRPTQGGLLVARIAILLADDHALFRQGLRRLIEEEPDMEVVAEAEDGLQAVQLAKQHKPAVAVLDISMPQLDGIEAGRRILAASPSTRTLLLSAYDSTDYVKRALHSGASGYLLKKVDMTTLAGSIRLVSSGELVIDTAPTGRLLRILMGEETRSHAGAGKLNPREMEVLRLVSAGKTNREVATELGISERTVQAHMLNIFKKLEVSSRTMAVLHALRQGWVALDDLP